MTQSELTFHQFSVFYSFIARIVFSGPHEILSPLVSTTTTNTVIARLRRDGVDWSVGFASQCCRSTTDVEGKLKWRMIKTSATINMLPPLAMQRYNNFHVVDGEVALLAFEFAFEPIVVHALQKFNDIAFDEAQLRVVLGFEVVQSARCRCLTVI